MTEIETKLNKYAVLKLYVNQSDVELTEVYKQHIQNHNNNILNDEFPNSGFDIFLPTDEVFDTSINNTMINFDIKTEMIFVDRKQELVENCAFFLFPRSSLSKTPLMLSNHTGIIDSGYRGWIQGAFRLLSNTSPFVLEKHIRVLQICHPSLCPILVELVNESDLSTTSRGSGGFGSTGLIGSI